MVCLLQHSHAARSCALFSVPWSCLVSSEGESYLVLTLCFESDLSASIVILKWKLYLTMSYVIWLPEARTRHVIFSFSFSQAARFCLLMKGVVGESQRRTQTLAQTSSTMLSVCLRSREKSTTTQHVDRTSSTFQSLTPPGPHFAGLWQSTIFWQEVTRANM